MRLTQRTDYALRILMHLAVDGRVSSVAGISSNFHLSRHHVMKVAQELARAGWVGAQRGRNGGLVLAADPQALTVGEVVRRMEPDFRLVECFDPETDECVLTPACHLRGALRQALTLFLSHLDAVTLADIVADRAGLAKLLQIDPAA